MFQSAPPAEARGDVRVARLHTADVRQRFNPLPLPKQGEIVCTRPVVVERHGQPVSIRSPCRSKGRSQCQARPGREAPAMVSIRSPCRSKGRYLAPAPGPCIREWFQSAPPAEARGDVWWSFRASFNLSMFQSAPPAEARGDLRRRPLAVKPGSSRTVYNVSIRSPCRSKGRSGASSVPLPAKCWLPSPSSFNPLPLPKQGEITWKTKNRNPSSRLPAALRGTCFNPLPLPKQGEISLTGRFEARGDVAGIIVHVSIRSPCRSKGRSPCGLPRYFDL